MIWGKRSEERAEPLYGPVEQPGAETGRGDMGCGEARRGVGTETAGGATGAISFRALRATLRSLGLF